MCGPQPDDFTDLDQYYGEAYGVPTRERRCGDPAPGPH